MPVGTALTYTDNQKLDTDGHNKNVYDADNNTGIMSESNGGLGASNLDTDFVAHAEHIFPETIAFGRQESMTDAVQCFSDKFGSRLTDTNTVTTSSNYQKYIKPIPGCGIRVYLPYTASAILWQWSYFFNSQMLFAVPGTDGGADSAADAVAFNGFLAMKRDGVLIESSIRALPPAVIHRNHKTGGVVPASHEVIIPGFRSKTARASMWRDMHYLETSASRLTKGWHDIQLCIHLEHPPISDTISNSEGKFAFVVEGDNTFLSTVIRGGDIDTHPAKASNAAVFGIRNARALVLY